MKKRLLSLILCLALLCPLCACSKSDEIDLMKLEGAERADAFFDLVNEEPTSSYKTIMKMTLEGSLYGNEINATIDSESIYADLDTDSPSYHSTGTSVIRLGAFAQTISVTNTTNGYKDGKIYESSDKAGIKNALISPISADEYKAHREFLTGFSDEELAELHKKATVKECIKVDDGTWSATFSGYSEEDVLTFVEYAFDSTVLLLDGYKVKDVVFSIKSDAEFLPTDWSYEMIFEKTSGNWHEAKSRVDITFCDISTATHPGINASDYTEVEGLADLQKIRKLMSDKFTDNNGSFTTDSEQSVVVAGTNQYSREIDAVSFKTENGKYSFRIDADINPNSITNSYTAVIKYSNGTYKMEGQGISTITQEMSDSEARAYLSQLYDPAGLSNAQISNIQLNTKGFTHLLTIENPDYSALETSLAGLGATDFNAVATLGIDFENGTIAKYKYTLILTAKVSGQTLTVEVQSTVSFGGGMNNEV